MATPDRPARGLGGADDPGPGAKAVASPRVRLAVQRTCSAAALIAIAVWLGGLIALGALAAPVVFSVVSWPANADAMTLVFRRFDSVAMGCAAVVLATEAVRAPIRPVTPFDLARAASSIAATALAVLEGTRISPRIAELHASGALRGVGAEGRELASLHALAEASGKAQLIMLAATIVFHVIVLSTARERSPKPEA